MTDWNKRISLIAMGIALTGIGSIVTCFVFLTLLIYFGIAMEGAKQFPLAAITVGAAMTAAVWFLSDRHIESA